MILNSYNNILVLAPHTDDGELGLGGTISKLIELGKKVTYVAFSTAQQSVPEGFPKDILKTEVKKATAQLGYHLKTSSSTIMRSVNSDMSGRKYWKN